MSFGDTFALAWNSASNEARAAASAIATGARAVVDTAETAGSAIAKTAKAVVSKTDDAAKWTLHEGERTGRAISKAAVAAKKATVNGVVAAYDSAKQAFSTAVATAATVGCVVENWGVGGIALNVGLVLTKPGISELLRPVLRQGGDESQKPFDGHVLGAGCQENSTAGTMPSGCFQKPGALPKISYINGINTRYTPEDKDKEKGLFSGGICKTMLEIAKITCSEVTGVYNATEGIGNDVDECLDNIGKNGNTPAIVPLADMIVKAARTGQPVTLFAHSQGGLITQEAVARAKLQLMNEDDLTSEEAEQRLGVVSIKSFGTALMGWPSGPHYERFTNTADPVPPIIIGAQTSYPVATWNDSAGAEQNHVFTNPHLNPIDSHSMDDTYLPRFRELKGAPHCACKGT